MTHTSISLRSSWCVLGVTLDCQASIRENELIFLGGAPGQEFDPWRVTLDSSFLNLQGEMFRKLKSSCLFSESKIWMYQVWFLADRLAAYTCSLPFSSLAGADTEGGAKVGNKEIEHVCWYGPLIPRRAKRENLYRSVGLETIWLEIKVSPLIYKHVSIKNMALNNF